MNPAPPAVGCHPAHGLLGAIATAAPGRDPYDWAAGLANVAAGRYPPYLRDALAERAFEFLETAFHGYDAEAPLEPWARTVLYHRLVDLRRRGRRTVPLVSEPHAPRPEAPDTRWAETFEAVRTALAAAHFFPNTADGPDHYAVFVFDLRIRLGERIGRGDGAGDKPLVTAAEHLPWPAWLGPRRFCPGWARVSELWAEVERRASIPAGTARVEFVGRCVRTVAPTVPWEPATWNQWVRRAKARLRGALIPHDTWDAYFERLFFDRDGRPEGAP